MNDELKLDINDGVGLLTLNRPDELNTLNNPLLEGIGEAYRRCNEDDAVRVVVITGAGRAFCTGAVLSDDETSWFLGILGLGEALRGRDREAQEPCEKL